MSDFLSYYEVELSSLDALGEKFSKDHPTIASHIGLRSPGNEDPLMSRLIESVAFLNARISKKIDDDHSSFSEDLMELMYPHYLRPIPSICIVKFDPDPDKLESVYSIPSETLLDTQQFDGEYCRFSTCYDVDVVPFHIGDVIVKARPFTAPGSANFKESDTVIQLRLDILNKALTFSALDVEQLILHTTGGQQIINCLFEALFQNLVGITVSDGEGKFVAELPVDSLSVVGFSDDSGILPYPKSSFIGYRVLTEYFSYPEKFNFIEVGNLKSILPLCGGSASINFFVKGIYGELERHLTSNNLLLGCTPAVNLFPMRAEPISLNQGKHEYRVVPDVRRPRGHEVYSINTVLSIDESGKSTPIPKLYGAGYQERNEFKYFWFAKRIESLMDADSGLDTLLSIVDLEFNETAPAGRTLGVELTCSNRDLPFKLATLSGARSLQCVKGYPPCSDIRFVSPPSQVLRPNLGNGSGWRLVSHFNLNRLSLIGGESSANVIKDILGLYNFKNSSSTRAVIDSILNVEIYPVSSPLCINGRFSICSGVEIELTLDGEKLVGTNIPLFVMVMDNYFSLYCAVNSFTRLKVKIEGREGVYKLCEPRSGGRKFV